MKHKHFRSLKKRVKQRPDKKNRIGTFTSWVWQMYENKIILALTDFFTEAGFRVGVLVFDGLMVERKTTAPMKLNESILRQAEAYILNQTGFKIILSEKPLTPSMEDYNKFWGPKALHKIPSTLDKQLYLLRMAGQQRCLKRMDGWTLKPHASIPGVFVRYEEDTIFINSVLKGKHLYRGASMKKLLEWFSTIDHPRFELLTSEKMNRNVISFQNCYLDLTSSSTLCFVEWTEVKPDEIPITNHYFDVSLIYMDGTWISQLLYGILCCPRSWAPLVTTAYLPYLICLRY